MLWFGLFSVSLCVFSHTFTATEKKKKNTPANLLFLKPYYICPPLDLCLKQSHTDITNKMKQQISVFVTYFIHTFKAKIHWWAWIMDEFGFCSFMLPQHRLIKGRIRGHTGWDLATDTSLSPFLPPSTPPSLCSCFCISRLLSPRPAKGLQLAGDSSADGPIASSWMSWGGAGGLHWGKG